MGVSLGAVAVLCPVGLHAVGQRDVGQQAAVVHHDPRQLDHRRPAVGRGHPRVGDANERSLPRTPPGPATVRTGETACPTGRSRASRSPAGSRPTRSAGRHCQWPGTGSNVVRSVRWLLLGPAQWSPGRATSCPRYLRPTRANAAARTRPGTGATIPAAPRRPATGAASPSATPPPPRPRGRPGPPPPTAAKPSRPWAERSPGLAGTESGSHGPRSGSGKDVRHDAGKRPHQHVPDQHVPDQPAHRQCRPW